MRGPIDYIIVGFDGNNFNGSILNALSDAVDKGIINVLSLALVLKKEDGTVESIEMSETGDEALLALGDRFGIDTSLVSHDYLDEIAELLEPFTSAGMLVLEHVWAKPLQQAIRGANGSLIAEGRIHPSAYEELNQESEGK